MNRWPAFHDPDAMTGREMMEHTGLTSGPETIGGVFGPAASIVLGQAKTTCTPSRPSSSQHSAGS
jgi:ornithine carbamoyltransferase